jgi:hypothetical protein
LLGRINKAREAKKRISRRTWDAPNVTFSPRDRAYTRRTQRGLRCGPQHAARCGRPHLLALLPGVDLPQRTPAGYMCVSLPKTQRRCSFVSRLRGYGPWQPSSCPCVSAPVGWRGGSRVVHTRGATSRALSPRAAASPFHAYAAAMGAPHAGIEAPLGDNRDSPQCWQEKNTCGTHNCAGCSRRSDRTTWHSRGDVAQCHLRLYSYTLEKRHGGRSNNREQNARGARARGWGFR